jgi:ATPase subunit of ABC transporter with duplicated ATPase domains
MNLQELIQYVKEKSGYTLILGSQLPPAAPVYQDTPISPAGTLSGPDDPAVPARIREMLALYDYGDGSNAQRVLNFYRQGKFMEHYEDDAPWEDEETPDDADTPEDEEMTELPEQEEAIFFKLGDEKSAIPSGKWVLQYENRTLLSKDGSTVLADELELKIRGSEKIAIIGNNGCGKTTMLEQIAEELLAREDLHAEYIPQNYEQLLDLDVSPVDYLDSSGEKEERTRIRTYLGSLKYTADEMDHPIRELSGGQKAKVLLLKLSMSGANVLVLDEPTRNFSPLSGPVIRRMLRDFPGCIISVSHDRKYLAEVCDTVYRLTPHGLVVEKM